MEEEGGSDYEEFSIDPRIYLFEYDLHERKITNNCSRQPSNAFKELPVRMVEWLYAVNNKYGDERSMDPDKIGKWMIFVPKDRVDFVWDQIKVAVTSGDLWHSKVSTYDPKQSTHAIMIYTKDYTDLNDVINTLDFLESSGIKPPGVNLKYKTDAMTRAGIYSGGKQKPWIYTSDTVRERNSTNTESSRQDWRAGPSNSARQQDSNNAQPSQFNWRARPSDKFQNKKPSNVQDTPLDWRARPS